MVAAANPLAAQAGREILASGGSAVDAAVAVQLVLNLVEPQSSGIGGGAFMVVWDGSGHHNPGRPRNRACCRKTRAVPRPRRQADEVLRRGRRRSSVGVPGAVRLLETAHKRWGKLPWKQVIEPAATLAENGFTISPRLNGLLGQEKFLQNDPVGPRLFLRPRGQAESGRNRAEESGFRQNTAAHRR